MSESMNTALTTRFELNSRIAKANRIAFGLAGVTAVSLVGPPGAGKTTVIEAISRTLKESMRLAAVIGNLAATRAAERLTELGVRAVAVQTDNLTAGDVHGALAELNLAITDLVFIESAGNNLSPVEFDLGQDLRIAVFSTAGGDDKTAEFARLIAESDLVLLTKIDLLPFVEFNLRTFSEDLRRIHPSIVTLHFSERTGCGVDACVSWLASRWSPDKQFRDHRLRDLSEWNQG